MKWIDLAAYACDPKSLNSRLATHCIVIMVAVDETGQKITVPTWEPESDIDKKQNQAVINLVEMRKQIGEEMKIFVE